jgi:hypothetical protein
MVEQEIIQLPESVTKVQAKMYAERLVTSCDLLRSLDTGNFPLTVYSSGETRQKKIFNKETRNWELVEEPVDLPIFKDQKSSMLGLRFALCSAIFSDFMMLSSWGLREEALCVINERKINGKTS